MDNKYWVVFGAHSGAIYEPMLYYTNLQANAKKKPNITKGLMQQICFFLWRIYLEAVASTYTNCEENLDHQLIAMYQYGSEYHLFRAFFRTCFYFF